MVKSQLKDSRKQIVPMGCIKILWVTEDFVQKLVHMLQIHEANFRFGIFACLIQPSQVCAQVLLDLGLIHVHIRPTEVEFRDNFKFVLRVNLFYLTHF